ncbi:MAG: 3-deoxy-D-manno-octulosonate 8-phosphate phosphatase [Deltaproteobacteria bacterium RIFOXYD12_FULL_53_23]|nr:MAG: 3-deoxy-D-manno-octulosonate 8-phosphate phosphatase [Deltaproteobacteria bacterium RIFOXYD12_FULL_53_23]
MTDPKACGISGGQYPSDCEVMEGLRQRALARTGQDERGYVWRNCLPLAKEIRLLLLDVDGVLTDGSVVYAQSGSELKTFNTKDGFGIRLLQEAGVEVGLITARSSEAVQRRAQDLKLAHVYQGVRNKIEVFARIIAEQKLVAKEVAYMGDDWLDLPLLSRVGLAVTVADAVAEVKAVAHYVTRREGGRGAVRELCDLIIEARGQREELLGRYLR